MLLSPIAKVRSPSSLNLPIDNSTLAEAELPPNKSSTADQSMRLLISSTAKNIANSVLNGGNKYLL